MGWPLRFGLALAVAAGAVLIPIFLRGTSEANGVVRGPVVSAAATSGGYPDARVEGSLNLRDGCLLLGESVVYWPAGTSWDAEGQAITFSGDFEGAPPVRVDSWFNGGGGFVALTDDYATQLGHAGERVRTCVAKTGATQIVFAYPSTFSS